MKSKKPSARQAQGYDQGHSASSSAISNEALLHELRVHQIELEVQNEQLRQAEIALTESRDHYVQLYEFAPVGYLALDSTGAISAINSTGCKFLQTERRRVLKTPFSRFVAPDDCGRWYALLVEARQQGEAEACEISLRPVNGVSRVVSVDCLRSDVDASAALLLVTLTDVTARKAAERALAEFNQQRYKATHQRYEASRHLLNAQEVLRRRMAGEFHDHTSPMLAAIRVSAEVASKALQRDDRVEVEARLEDIGALVEDTINHIRDICADLRPPALDHAGLLAGIKAYASHFVRRTGIAVEIDCPHDNIRKGPELESMLFRIFQEALTNSAKHARCSSVLVTLRLDRKPLLLSMVDDGCGFDLEESAPGLGQGLVSMREMAELSGGTFDIDARPGHGTQVRVEILA